MKIEHKTHKKTFAIIVGNELQIIGKNSLDEAIIYAQNYLNQSKEIIVREIKNIRDFVSPIYEV